MNDLKTIRWQQRFENFSKSYGLLNRYIEKPLQSELEQAGLIQFFEISFELAWKVMKDYLEAEGFSPKSPRQVIKTAFQFGLIDNASLWLEALENRNLSAHTYDQNTAEQVILSIKGAYFPELKKLYNKLLKEI